jgi:hypothetical protein
MPLTDEWGYVRIFTCANQIEELENQTVWYTNINNAIKRMISTNPRAEIFEAQVNIRDIKSYSSKQADIK